MKLTNRKIFIERYETVTSTNDILKEKALGGAPEGTVVIADSQTAGRGRMGRRFHSPAGKGIYMSILLKPAKESDEISLTAHAAVAVAKAIEKQTERAVMIKWVNDIYIGGRKVCGILSEKSAGSVIVGIGINLSEPENGYPEEIRGIAGAIIGKNEACDSNALICEIISGIFKSNESLYKDYVSRSMLDGKNVLVRQGSSVYPARVLGIGKDLALRLLLEDGTETALRSGEVSVALYNKI